MVSQKINYIGLLLTLCLWSTACSSLKSSQGSQRAEINVILSDLVVPDPSAVPNGRIILASLSREDSSPEPSPAKQAKAKPRAKSPSKPRYPQSPNVPRPDYRLGLGDNLELVYQYTHDPKKEEYRFRIKDQIGLSFLNFPDYNRSLMIREDGKIELPLVGEIMAAGRTFNEIRAVIEKAYAAQQETPQIDIYTINYTTREEELYASLLNAQLGPARRMIVRPDGYISAPLIGDIRAAGRTVDELHTVIMGFYRAKGLPNISVTVLVISTPSSVAYVMGEVMRQGPVNLRGPFDAWRTIAEAGGFTPNADRKHVVVTKRVNGSDERFEIDFDAWREGTGENIEINSGDLIYVSKLPDQFVYITGEVKFPGRIDLAVETRLTVSQAVAMGRGITDRGVRDKALLLRKSTGSSAPETIEVDLKTIRKMKEEGLAWTDQALKIDPLMEPGDIVHIPISTAGKANWFAKRWFADVIWTILPFTSSASYTYQSGSVKSNP